MRIAKLLTIPSVALLFASCSNNTTTAIGDKVFIHQDKVYRLVGNDVVLVASLDEKNIQKASDIKPVEKHYQDIDLGYVKPGATAKVKGIVYGNRLHFKIRLDGLNDLKTRFSSGGFTINFLDSQGFVLHDKQLTMSDFTGMVDGNGTVSAYETEGTIEVEAETKNSISSVSMTSFVKASE